MTANANVAATINSDCDNWHYVAGLQIRGTVDVVEGMERAKGFGNRVEFAP